MFRAIYNTYTSEGFVNTNNSTNLTIPHQDIITELVKLQKDTVVSSQSPKQETVKKSQSSKSNSLIKASNTFNINTPKTRDICTPLPDGNLSRDCMLQQISVAGCKPDGALYTALLNEAIPTNYLNGALNLTSYKTYQQFSNNPFLEDAIKQGKTTTDLALANFRHLANEASQVKETALNYAARDLCLKKDIMDTFDFCLDLKDITRAPFSLECLQKEFRNQGGNSRGSLYPTSSTKFSIYDKLNTWRDVKAFMSDIKFKTKSKDEAVKTDALLKFSGIQNKVLSKQIAKTTGLEILWFNRGTNTFLGRRIVNTENQNKIDREMQITMPYDFSEYYIFTNIRPPTTMKVRMRLEPNDSMIYVLEQGTNVWDQSTNLSANHCWELLANGPNFISGTWQEKGIIVHPKILYASCKSNTFQSIPMDWFSLVQEAKAPVFSWQGRNINNSIRFTDVRLSNVMDMVASPKTSMQTFSTPIFKTLMTAIKIKSNGNGYANVRRNFAMNSWKTLTLGFIPLSTIRNQGEAAKLLLKLGPLSIYTFGIDCVMRWNSATLNIEKTFTGILIAGQDYYLAVSMKSDRNDAHPNRIKFAIGKSNDWNSGAISLENSSSNSISYSTTDNTPIYNVSDSAELVLGDKAGNNTADVAIAFVRLFDYGLGDTDCYRDINNAWAVPN